jgi:hypothetical protein
MVWWGGKQISCAGLIKGFYDFLVSVGTRNDYDALEILVRSRKYRSRVEAWDVFIFFYWFNSSLLVFFLPTRF